MSLELRYARDIYGKGWYINLNHVIYAEKVEDSTTILQLTGKNELKQCYILNMIDGKRLVLANMI